MKCCSRILFNAGILVTFVLVARAQLIPESEKMKRSKENFEQAISEIETTLKEYANVLTESSQAETTLWRKSMIDVLAKIALETSTIYKKGESYETLSKNTKGLWTKYFELEKECKINEGYETENLPVEILAMKKACAEALKSEDIKRINSALYEFNYTANLMTDVLAKNLSTKWVNVVLAQLNLKKDNDHWRPQLEINRQITVYEKTRTNDDPKQLRCLFGSLLTNKTLAAWNNHKKVYTRINVLLDEYLGAVLDEIPNYKKSQWVLRSWHKIVTITKDAIVNGRHENTIIDLKKELSEYFALANELIKLKLGAYGYATIFPKTAEMAVADVVLDYTLTYEIKDLNIALDMYLTATKEAAVVEDKNTQQLYETWINSLQALLKANVEDPLNAYDRYQWDLWYEAKVEMENSYEKIIKSFEESLLPASACLSNFIKAFDDNMSEETGTNMLEECLDKTSKASDPATETLHLALRDLLEAKLIWFRTRNVKHAHSREDYETEKYVWLYKQEEHTTRLPNTGNLELAIKQLDKASNIKDELENLIKASSEDAGKLEDNDDVGKCLYSAMVAYLEEKYGKNGSDDTVMEKRMDYTKAMIGWKKKQLENADGVEDLPLTADIRKVESDISEHEKMKSYDKILNILESYKRNAMAGSNLGAEKLHEKFLVWLDAKISEVYLQIVKGKAIPYKEVMLDWREEPIEKFGLPLTKEMKAAHRALSTFSYNHGKIPQREVQDYIKKVTEIDQSSDEKLNELYASWLSVLVALNEVVSGDGRKSKEDLIALKTNWDDYYKVKKQWNKQQVETKVAASK